MSLVGESREYKLYSNDTTELLTEHGEEVGFACYLLEHKNGFKTYVLYDKYGLPAYESQQFEAIVTHIDMHKINRQFEGAKLNERIKKSN